MAKKRRKQVGQPGSTGSGIGVVAAQETSADSPWERDEVDRESAPDDLGDDEAMEYVSDDEDEIPPQGRGRLLISSHMEQPLVRAVGSRPGPSRPVTQVFGPTDDRQPVQNASAYPLRTVCRLVMSGRSYGTGWMAGPRLVVTAAHNLCHNPQLGGGWVDSVEVYPAKNGGSQPLHTFAVKKYVAEAWRRDRDVAYDYGAIVLRDPLGDETGWLGFKPWPSREIAQMNLNVVGYPYDKGGQDMWWSLGRASQVNHYTLLYRMDTEAGNSGGPLIFLPEDGKAYCVGIHSGPDAGYNRATRITPTVVSNILAWSSQ